MASPAHQRPDLVPLIDLEADDARLVCDAMSNVGLEAVQERIDGGPDATDLTKAVIRIFVPRGQVRDARAVVKGVLPEYGHAADTRPETLPAGEADQWSQIVAGLRQDGFDEPTAPAPVPVEAPEVGYVPPAPPPIPRPRRGTLLAWGAMGLGILIVVLSSALSIGFLGSSEPE